MNYRRLIKSLVLVMAVALGNIAMAQEYYPLVRDDVRQEWNVYVMILDSTNEYFENYNNTIVTLTLGEEYEQVVYDYYIGQFVTNTFRKVMINKDPLVYVGEYVGLREEDKIALLYNWVHYDSKEIFLYNFNKNLNPDDYCLYSHCMYGMFGTGIDSIQMFDGTYRTRIHLGNSLYWIEGIGSNYGLLNNDGTANCSIYSSILVSYYEDGKLIWRNPDFSDTGIEGQVKPMFAISPNPAQSNFTIKGIEGNYSYTLFNAMGQLVKTGTACGEEPINVEGMAKGIYMLKVSTEMGVETQRVVVE